MQIIEIEEPGKSELQDEIVVGIDFGTTNSLIAYSRHNNPQIINSVGKNGLLPSVLLCCERSRLAGCDWASQARVPADRKCLVRADLRC